ncbi:RNA ligase RtcB family protein [Novosphingobium terrae]|uniref:RNA ligase RtcB family protein n=1 Tax=Novosphingobium terrae TaxID=2726189 RepID=UPI0019815EA0|nr:RNA ligase RtcB family protein [Novosphingobium terrae]
MSQITLIASDPARFDPLALDQLQATARYGGMARIVGLPDLHAGNGIAVGAAFWSPDRIWPHLVGSDIGCGMALWETDCSLRKFRLGSIERKLHGLDAPWPGDGAAALADAGLPADLASPALGTIGGGNHFVEFQRIEEMVDEARFAALGLRQDRVWMMVHSGSRGLGQAILQAHRQAEITEGIAASSPAATAYLAEHDAALDWAVLNRRIIAERFCACLGLTGRRVLDICHNSVTPHQSGWLHRKGAAPADRGLVTIPGSRGDFSYLVEPIADKADHALHSLAHGAGRKWSRKDAHARLSRRFKVADMQRTDLGSHVICEDRRLIFEEAPDAYKDIAMVIANLEQAGLIRVIARLRPLLSYKTRAA